ncbi:PAS domain-containing protein [Salipiger bermudensis]|uniref:PAS domain-containing protein n=1 Tax=Salipiger bermudensis TaxID=344736 RepID=UPI001C9A28CC|nr:PAS domain-containing protein [Salipiger bermudensis]MBY6004989.1 PAS domain-containing protein [Salipiger bermudensis]
MILNGEQVSLRALALMQGHLAERAAVCAKVIDREGKVVGINRRGLEMLGVESDDVCGKVWTGFWKGGEAIKAEEAVSDAFAGRSSAFTGEYFGTGQRTIWEIEVFPLERDEDGVRTILALSIDVTGRYAPEATIDEAGLLGSLNETLHAMANIATVSQSSSRMLPRAKDDRIITEIASELAQAARRAQDAISELRNALTGGKGAKSGR